MAGKAPNTAAAWADDGVGRVDGWPLQTRLCLGALRGAVPCARLHARNVLWEWGLNALAEDAELVVSELVTNAVAAAQRRAFQASSAEPSTGPVPIWLALSSDRQAVVIQAWDANPDPPIARCGDLDADGGRGLLIVRALAETWNWYRPRGSGGKTVWAVIRADLAGETPVTGERPGRGVR